MTNLAPREVILLKKAQRALQAELTAIPFFGYIAPMSYLDLVPKDANFHLCLAHLCEDSAYCQFYREKHDRGDFIIMDNSAFEFGGSIEPVRLLDLIEKSNIRPNVIVSPDYPGQHSSKTLDSMHEFMDIIAEQYDGKYKIMSVPQSRVGHWDEWVDCYLQMSDHVDFIGMSILGIPNAAQGMTGTKDISYNRTWATLELLRCRIIDPTIWHHYLGAGSPSEVRIQRQLGVMTSMDTSSPIWHAINKIAYDDTATGLREGKIKKHVDFNIKRDDDYEVLIRQTAENNIEYIKNCLK